MKEISKDELKNLNGGFIGILGVIVPIAFQAAFVFLLAAGVASSFQLGYNSLIEKKQ